MKDALYHIISSIVDNPDKIIIDELEENGNIQFTVKLAAEDMGKVIGKEGKVIRAIRNIMRIPAVEEGKKIYIALSE